MTDIQPPLEPHRRHWVEYVATAAALLISAVSLWVAIRTEDANNKMVAAASWPYLQVSTNDTTPDGQSVLSFDVVNAGVGPAMVETFEVWLDGKPVHSAEEALARCCGYDPKKPHPVVTHQPNIGSWTQGTIANTVIRAGESRTFFKYPQTAANVAAWTTLRNAVSTGRLVARACYCSVFEECWQGVFTGLHPKRVDRCPVPAVPYN
ncbi:MAG: hypothetical protein JSR60_10585 [Proteobacteria bacterium]|nr:hypothetical protein [Pseudomonadota bacterium]